MTNKVKKLLILTASLLLTLTLTTTGIVLFTPSKSVWECAGYVKSGESERLVGWAGNEKGWHPMGSGKIEEALEALDGLELGIRLGKRSVSECSKMLVIENHETRQVQYFCFNAKYTQIWVFAVDFESSVDAGDVCHRAYRMKNAEMAREFFEGFFGQAETEDEIVDM